MDIKTNNLIESTKTKEELIKEGCIVIRTWMAGIKLSVIQLLLLAIIYDLTKDGVGICNLSLNEFKMLTGASKSKISVALKELADKRLIVKTGHNAVPGSVNEYKVDFDILKYFIN